jgi:outer membrane protein OmpA-like peptidoglycan-associated protein
MSTRARTFIAATLAAAIALPAAVSAEPMKPFRLKVQSGGNRIEIVQGNMPSAIQIQRSLEAQPRLKLRRSKRVTMQEFKRSVELRQMAPSIDIQAINFAFGSAEIPYSQYGKVENISIALNQLRAKGGAVRILIEGHTDAVGSGNSNLMLSWRRAESLKWALVEHFGVPASMLDTVGYGEDFLLVPTPYEDWRNRRVTFVRADGFVD